MKNKTLFEQYLEADSNRQELLKKYQNGLRIVDYFSSTFPSTHKIIELYEYKGLYFIECKILLGIENMRHYETYIFSFEEDIIVEHNYSEVFEKYTHEEVNQNSISINHKLRWKVIYEQVLRGICLVPSNKKFIYQTFTPRLARNIMAVSDCPIDLQFPFKLRVETNSLCREYVKYVFSCFTNIDVFTFLDIDGKVSFLNI